MWMSEEIYVCPLDKKPCLKDKCMAWRYYKDQGYCALIPQ